MARTFRLRAGWRRGQVLALVLVLTLVLILVAAPSRSADGARSESGSVLAAPHALLQLADWHVSGGQPGVALGKSVAMAGDVNGDTYTDVLVGAPDATGDLLYEGWALAYYGSASGPVTTASWMAEGDQARAELGWSVAAAGDVNGDGFDDVIVGAPMYDGVASASGRAYVYTGSASGLSASPAWTGNGIGTWDYYGWSVAGAGDVNNDGFDDIIVGAIGAERDNADRGCAYVYHGSAAGVAISAAWTACGESVSASFGRSVAGAGDVNNDGFDDVIVGAPGTTGAEDWEGKAYVYHGASGGLATTAAWTVSGGQADASLGDYVAAAGDVNNDGYDDVVVGAWSYDVVDGDEGRAWVYHGSANGLAATAAWTGSGSAPNAWFGEALAGAGDVNNDGYDDVAIAAPGSDGAKESEGSVFVYRGSADGLVAAPAEVYSGHQSGAGFGTGVSLSGDLDGDGRADLLVGAPRHDDGHLAEGAAFAYYSGSPDAETFVVDSDADGTDAEDQTRGDGVCADPQGRCTLRAAIQEANMHRGADRITFARPMTITVSADAGELPDLLEQVAVDAGSMWDVDAMRPGVALSGGGASFNGLDVRDDACELYGLYITGFSVGLYVQSGGNTIGGPGAGQRNVIAGNSNTGLALVGTGARANVVQANYLGLHPSGAAAQSNYSGIWVAFGAAVNIIGGFGPGRGNVISGNLADGIKIESTGSDGNIIVGNTIGLGADGLTAVGNAVGITIGSGAGDTNIGFGTDSGGTTTGLGSEIVTHGIADPDNTIAHNTSHGIRVWGNGGGVYVQNSLIHDNGSDGVRIEGRAGNVVAASEIRANGGHGVLVSGTTAISNTVSHNSIVGNSGRGIRLEGGGNIELAAPTMFVAGPSGAAGTACELCKVEVFSDTAGQGEIYHGAVEADANGNWTYVGPLLGPNVTTTATDVDGNTSEFSAPWLIGPTSTPTATTAPTATATLTASATTTPATATPSPAATVTPTTEPTITTQPTATGTATATATATATSAPTNTATAQPSATASPTPTETVRPSLTPTAAPSATPEPTATAEGPAGIVYLPFARQWRP